jgi:alpha-beta hydrolase superfamily lysophospholipase
MIDVTARLKQSIRGDTMKKRIEFVRGNLTIRGHLWGKKNTPQHAVILSHGFLANERMCFKYAKLLAEMGYLAVTFDFCGGGILSRSDGHSQDMTVLTEKADLLAVIEGVKEQFSPTGITLFGCSQGGFVSGLLASELGNAVIDKLILFYPAVCIPDDARKGKMMFYSFDPIHIPDVLGRFPMKLGGDYARTVINMNPYEEMKGYVGPVLLVHGTADTIVNIRCIRELKELYADCRYEEIEGGGHVFKGKADERACGILRDFMCSK